MSFARAAVVGSKVKSRCDINLHTTHHDCGHSTGGECSQGSPNVFFNGAAAVRLNDAVIFSKCQHSAGLGKTISGSGSVFVNGKPAVRIKDAVQCADPVCGQIGRVSQGCSSIFVGD